MKPQNSAGEAQNSAWKAEFRGEAQNSAGKAEFRGEAQNSAGIECSGAFTTGCQAREAQVAWIGGGVQSAWNQPQSAGVWSVRVSGYWRVVFRFENHEVVDVNLIDYH